MFTSQSPEAQPPCAGAGNLSTSTASIPPQPFISLDNVGTCKRKRRPAGTPDPDAEVVSLSPRTLMESDRYVCEICNQGFQRDQNLQMHRRRHKVPWKLLKREGGEVRKRVFVCPEPSCLHHDPTHALGDLVGIKKHFRRKHSAQKQWSCSKCSKAYAVQSDYKAHLKTCGTRGHSCDCGRVFSRVESFIEHQDVCNAGRPRAEPPAPPPACLSRTASSPSPSSETNFSAGTMPGLRLPNPTAIFLHPDLTPSSSADRHHPTRNIELQLLPSSSTHAPAFSSSSSTMRSPTSDEARITKLQLAIGLGTDRDPALAAMRLKDEKALLEETRQQAKRQIELADQEFATAKMIRLRAQAELDRAHAMRDHATKMINSTLLEITCQACKQLFRAKHEMPSDENSLPASFVSSVMTEGERQDDKP